MITKLLKPFSLGLPLCLGACSLGYLAEYNTFTPQSGEGPLVGRVLLHDRTGQSYDADVNICMTQDNQPKCGQIQKRGLLSARFKQAYVGYVFLPFKPGVVELTSLTFKPSYNETYRYTFGGLKITMPEGGDLASFGDIIFEVGPPDAADKRFPTLHLTKVEQNQVAAQRFLAEHQKIKKPQYMIMFANFKVDKKTLSMKASKETVTYTPGQVIYVPMYY
jgi:hypothetical protein